MLRGRIGLISALLAVALYGAGQVISGLPPAPDAADAEVVSHFTEDRAGVLVGAVLGFVAIAFLLVFLGHLRSAMVDAEQGRTEAASAMVVGWVLLFATIGIGGLPLLAITWRGAAEASPELLTFAFDLNNLALYAGSAAFAATSIAVPTVVAWRTGFLPRWLVALGALEVAVNVIELIGITTRTGPNALGYAAGLGPPIWIAWVLAAAIVLDRRRVMA